MYSKLYPPIINDIPAFDNRGLKVTYAVPNLNNTSNIGSVYVVVKNRKGTEIFHEAKYSYTASQTLYIAVGRDWNLEAGDYVRVQIRFIDTYGENSEMSTVALAKYITAPTLTIENLYFNDIKQITASGYKFIGNMEIDYESGEIEEYYRFKLYDETYNVISNSSSGWLLHDSQKHDSYVCPILLEDGKLYHLGYSVKTVNGYQSKEYIITFINDETIVNEDNEYKIVAAAGDSSISLTVTLPSSVNNWLVLRRCKNNTIYEDIKYIHSSATDELKYDDYTVDSGASYTYALYTEYMDGTRVKRCESSSVSATFEDIYLYRDGKQLCIRYNPQISALSNTILDTEVQTIGSKYPVILRSGATNYKKFTLTGTLSMLSDENYEFLPSSDYSAIVGTYGAEVDLDDEAHYKEKKFREAVNEWLNDGEYKLYKSHTENNMIVYCQKINLTPNKTVGRLISDISINIIEVAECNIENLQKYNIEPLGEYTIDNLEGTSDDTYYYYLTEDCYAGEDVYAGLVEDAYDNIELSNEDENAIITSLKDVSIYSHVNSRWMIDNKEIVIPVGNVFRTDEVTSIECISTGVDGPITVEVKYKANYVTEVKDTESVTSSSLYEGLFQVVTTSIPTATTLASLINVDTIDTLYYSKIYGYPGTVITETGGTASTLQNVDEYYSFDTEDFDTTNTFTAIPPTFQTFSDATESQKQNDAKIFIDVACKYTPSETEEDDM